MTQPDRLTAITRESSANAVISWGLVVVLGIPLIGSLWTGRYEPVVFSLAALIIILAPAITRRDPTVFAPWYLIGVICLPVIWEALAPQPFVTRFIPSLATAALGLLIAVELHRFTRLHLIPWFAVLLTVLFTMAMGGLYHMLRWTADVFVGTSFLLDGRSQDAINAAVMIELIYTTLAGILAGGLFYLYFKHNGREHGKSEQVKSRPRAKRENVEGIPLSRRIGIPLAYQRRIVTGMQIVLIGLFGYGAVSRDIAIATNALIAIGVTLIPPILERDYRIPIEPGLVLWITTAVFLHTLGTAGLYDAIAPWDHLTHTFSATVVAAAGYATLRAIHLHEEHIYLPRWALFAFTLVFVLTMGVVWEILEFFADQGALYMGLDPVLAQHGIDDTIVDMMFNLLGAIIVATWGTIYLTEVSESLADRLETWTSG